MSDHIREMVTQRPMKAPPPERVFGTLQHFLKWAWEHKDLDESYIYADAQNCPAAQYAKAHLPNVVGVAGGHAWASGHRTSSVDLKNGDFPPLHIDGRIEELAIRNQSRTWKGLVLLAEAYLESQK